MSAGGPAARGPRTAESSLGGRVGVTRTHCTGPGQRHSSIHAKENRSGDQAVGREAGTPYRPWVRALVLDDRPRLVDDRQVLERPPGEARIELDLAGICDTDLQLVRGYMGYRGVLGHEFVGHVVESDDPAWLGRRVVADINANCGSCPECRAGNGHHCVHRSVLGILGRDGVLAEQFLVPQRCLVAVPDSVSDDQAVFAEPLAAAAHVLDDPGVERASRTIVLGDGKLGLLTTLALVAADKDATLVGHYPRKLAIAELAGASTCLETDAHELERAEIVVEATGSAAGLALALQLVRPRGTVVLKTTIANPVEADLAPVVVDELRLVGSRCGDIGRGLDLLARERVDPRPLIDARYPLREAEAALAHAARRGTLKVVVQR